MGKLIIELIQFGNSLLRLFLLAFQFLHYFAPIFLLFFKSFYAFLEVLHLNVYSCLFVLKANPLLIDHILQFRYFMLVFRYNHLALL